MTLSPPTKRTPQGFALLVNASLRIFTTVFTRSKGDIYTDDGIKIGTHDGLMYYTIGQRGGIGIGGVANRPEEPWFVLHKDLTNNRLIVGQGMTTPCYNLTSLPLINWIGELPPVQIFGKQGFRCTAKTRYRQSDQDCTVFALDETGDTVKVVFGDAQRAVTQGQSVVFYDGDICLGVG